MGMQCCKDWSYMHIAVWKFVKFGKVIDARAFMRLSMAVLCNFQGAVPDGSDLSRVSESSR